MAEPMTDKRLAELRAAADRMETRTSLRECLDEIDRLRAENARLTKALRA